MTSDLTDYFLATSRRAANWSAAAFLMERRTLLERLGFTVDWDKGAGEAWARILAGRRLVAILWSRAPLAFVLEGSNSEVTDAMKSNSVEVVQTSDFDAQLYRLRPEALRVANPDGDWPAEVSPERLSIQELWWATV